MADVFISYAREDDQPFAMRLHKDLAAKGVTVWWDQTAMESRGRPLLQELRDAIESDRNQWAESAYLTDCIHLSDGAGCYGPKRLRFLGVCFRGDRWRFR